MALTVVFGVMCMGFTAHGADSAAIYVSPGGNDGADGSFSNPVASIEAAKELAKAKEGDVTVYFREGRYTLNNTVNFTAQDKSGVTYKAYNGENVMFTAGTPYTGFEECSVNGVKAFKKYVGKDADFNILFN